MRGLCAALMICAAGCYPSLDDAPFKARDVGVDIPVDVEPDFAPSENLVFVDAAAQVAGTGAEQRPFQSVQEALATDALVIAVAAGRYEVPTEWTFLARRRIVGQGAQTVFTARGEVVWTAARGVELDGLLWEAPLVIKGDVVAESVAWADGLTIEGVTTSQLEACTATGRGIRVLGRAQLGISGLSITDVAGTALRLEVSAASINDLEIDGAVADADDAGDGVDILGGRVTIARATIRDVELRGVTSTDAVLDLRAVEVTKASAGIWLAGAESSITDCAVSDTERTGILLVGAPERGTYTVRNTTVRNAKLAGVQAQNADITLAKSEFSGTGLSGNDGHGLSLVNSHADASNCVFAGNETNGVYVPYPSSAALDSNEYTENLLWGVLSVCGEGFEVPEVTDLNSTFEGNGSGESGSILCTPPP